MPTTIDILTQTIVPSAAAVLAAVVSWGAAEAVRWVRVRTRNEKINQSMGVIAHTVELTVADLEQTLVSEFKKAAEDGRLSKTDQAHIKAIAISRVLQQLTPAIRKMASLSVTSLEDLVSNYIEKVVHDNKSRPMVKNT